VTSTPHHAGHPKVSSLTLALAMALFTVLSPLICVAQPAAVPLEAAKLAAAEKLPTFFPGRWNYHSSVVLFDLAGDPAAYAIVFSIDGQTPPPGLARLEALTEARSKDIAEIWSSIRGYGSTRIIRAGR